MPAYRLGDSRQECHNDVETVAVARGERCSFKHILYILTYLSYNENS